MSDLKKLEMMKIKVDEAVSERDKLQGRLDSDMDKLKVLGYDTLEAADKYVDKARVELEKKQKVFDADLQEFEEKYAQYL